MSEIVQGKQLLDCTLRDGGYYTQWDFPRSIVQEYLYCMRDLEIDIVEIGFRGLGATGFLGASAYSTDQYLKSLDIPTEFILAVMVNANDLLEYTGGPAYAVSSLFDDASNSPVSLVRLACHFRELENIEPAIIKLKSLGYSVGLNLMQVANRSDAELATFSDICLRNDVDYCYIADSTGGLSPNEVEGIVKGFLNLGLKRVGVHMHDNMGLAVANSVAAIRSGACLTDCTVTGMGRGPGNAATELLVNNSIFNRVNENPVGLIKLITKYFFPLKSRLQWGSNYYYAFAARNDIHPTYVQEMVGSSRYDPESTMLMLQGLIGCGLTYNESTLIPANACGDYVAVGDWAPVDEFDDREVLIIGSGASIRRYSDALTLFIKERNVLVITLNVTNDLDCNLIDYIVSCHPDKLITEAGLRRSSGLKSITPIIEGDPSCENRVFGVTVKPDCFSIKSTSCVLPNALSLGYAIAISISGKAKKIYLAGIDGFGDERNLQVTEALLLARQNMDSHQQLVSLTPTQFDLITESVFKL
jgi:4-hydroxy 2-oxovalerate aldolase